MVKIDKKIVAYSIVTSKRESIMEPLLQKMNEELSRPNYLIGETYKIKTPLSDHALYITINDIILNEGMSCEVRRPFEVFINSKSMEHFQWIVALTRVISAMFRKGGDCTFLIEELRSVFDPKGGYFKKGGKYMPSLVSEIGEVLEQHFIKAGWIVEDNSLAIAAQGMLKEKKSSTEKALICTKCGEQTAILLDNCLTCTSCGASKCG